MTSQAGVLHLPFVKSGAVHVGAWHREVASHDRRDCPVAAEHHLGLAGHLLGDFRAKNGPVGRKAWVTKSPPQCTTILQQADFNAIAFPRNAPFV